ncbi:NADH-quinone oxidoreductase subunit B family protein [Petrachloros mirabilis]
MSNDTQIKSPITPSRPTLGVFKFASCDGCQLSVLNLEEELLALGKALDIAYFPEASSRMEGGPYDIGLVEGSITAAEDIPRILEIRRQVKFLITIGACATAGGIQALRNWASIDGFKALVYPSPQYVESLSTSTPISAHVAVDFELWGCPIDKGQLLRIITDLLGNIRPRLPADSVCLECKRRGNTCVLVTKAVPCLGPVTRTGCGAICPAMGRDCYGCFGPVEGPTPPVNHPPNTRSLAQRFHDDLGLAPIEITRRFRGITGAAEPFKQEADAWDRRGDAG